MHKLFSALLFVSLFMLWQLSYAAKPVDLSRQNASILQSFIVSPALKKSEIQLQETKRSLDFKKTLHIRVQETYQNYPVFGADAIIHIPNGWSVPKSMTGIVTAGKNTQTTMDGILYQDIAADLSNTPAYVFGHAQAQKALLSAIDDYQRKVGKRLNIKDQKSDLVVFVDDHNKAHWAYQISFYVEPYKTGDLPTKPTYLLDAVSLHVYAQWNQIKTAARTDTFGGGFGGNVKIGRLVYDGLIGHLSKLDIHRDDIMQTCYLENQNVIVKRYSDHQVMTYPCSSVDPEHNYVYWDGDFDAVNGAFSPGNDMLHAGTVVYNMYHDGYNVTLLSRNGEPMKIKTLVHANFANAYWDGEHLVSGDGNGDFYPFVSVWLVGHEFSHGVTEQYSDLNYFGQSGGINEAFSDMAGKAAEFYTFGRNDWQLGAGIFKDEGKAFGYMDRPSKDCGYRRNPGDNCSIDDATQYRPGIDVHLSKGVYNRFFYLLSTSPNWDTKKAFHVMLLANMNYWTTNTDFIKGACGVIKSAKDLGFDVTAVKAAFDIVKVNYHSCS